MRRAIVALGLATLVAWPVSASGTHVRPKAASLLNVALVPSFQPCAAPDRQHGPPLAFPSCSAPDSTSSYLTVGTPDVNGFPAQSTAHFKWKVYPGVPGPPADNVHVFDLSISDVRCRAAGPGCAAPGADYAGSVELRIASQISDHNNNVAPGGGSNPATTQPFDFGFDVTCTTTSDPAIGSMCADNIHYIENVIGASIPDSARTVWELGQVQLFDGGADADGSTAGDNTLFAVEGLFVP
jgi:hypothetical protein